MVMGDILKLARARLLLTSTSEVQAGDTRLVNAYIGLV